MAARLKRRLLQKTPGDELLRRLQGMLYEFHGMGRFEDARPHILWLMEIAQAENQPSDGALKAYNA